MPLRDVILKLLVFTSRILYQVVEKVVFPQLVKNIRMQGTRNHEE